MAFLLEMHNKRDMIFWNIKINRVIIPLTPYSSYRDSEQFSREERVYMPNRKNYLNWGALPPAPPFKWGFAPLLGGALPPLLGGALPPNTLFLI